MEIKLIGTLAAMIALGGISVLTADDLWDDAQEERPANQQQMRKTGPDEDRQDRNQETGRGPKRGGEGRNQARGEFGGDPNQNRGPGAAGGPGGGQFRDQMEQMMRMATILEVEDPKKYEDLKKLKEQNPEKFRDELQKAMRQSREKMQKEQREFNELVEQFRKNNNDELKKKIQTKLTEQFDLNYKVREKNLEKMRERCTETQKKLEARQQKRQEIIDAKLEDVLKDPDMKW